MQSYDVDEELAALIERFAKAKPFENLSFNDALWRVVRRYVPSDDEMENLSDALHEIANRPLPPIIRDTFGVPSTKDSNTDKVIHPDLEKLLADAMARRVKKAASPSASEWASSVRSLRGKGFSGWKDICDFLKIDPAGDSARRSLQRWVKSQRPDWPPVPNP